MGIAKITVFTAVLACTVIANSASRAAVVTATNSVDYAFNVSALGDNISIAGVQYFCDPALGTQLCPVGGSTTDPDYLRAGGKFQLEFGTAQGSNNLGTRVVTNNGLSPIDNLAFSLNAASIVSPSGNVPIPDSLATLWVRVMFVNDDFGISRFRITSPAIIEALQAIEVSAVPVPAALPLFASALGIAGLFGYRRKRNAAAA